jgi:predicted nucleic acid-binding protein
MPNPISSEVHPIAVVDASVVAKWFLKDKVACSAATQMREDFVEGRISLVAPSLFTYEMASLLGIAVKRGRLTAEDANVAFEELTAMRIPLVEHGSIGPLAVSLAASNGQSAYDNTYVALAMALNSPFYTADKLLIRNLGPEYANWVRDIEVYGAPL